MGPIIPNDKQDVEDYEPELIRGESLDSATMTEWTEAQTNLRAAMGTVELEKTLQEQEAGRLPTDAASRKAIPIATGFVDYFPLAMACVAELSRAGNEQHNPGKPLFWDRSKSQDHPDCLMRHFLERGTLDSDGIRHSAKVAWRAMALLQKELEGES